MAKRLGPRSPRSPMATVTAVAPENTAASKMFDQFCTANTFQAIMGNFHQMCDLLEIRPNEHRPFYKLLKTRLTSWKAQSLWAKLDKRASHREYKKSSSAVHTRVLVIGCGPCGLRTAIEVALLGGKVVVVEKRDRFSRNNVLHLWPFLIHDLKAFGAKKFFGKFCAGAIDHISIRTLQCILLKIALLMGVEVHGGVGFTNLAEPEQGSQENCGWRAKVEPADHPVSEFEFDVLVGADGKRNTLSGFKRKEFRGKLAIAITANFINRNTQLEARVEEISGVAYIFNQKFFKDLNQQSGIDLENIVYYKDETHYFVMTAKKHSLLNKGVLRQDYDDPAKLLARENVDQEELMNYAREAADVSTNHMLPHLDFAHNHYGQPDVAMFDFTSMFAAEHASRIIEKNGKRLLVCLVGDSLLEPFWPTGSGCARGFLSALDTAWIIRSWVSGKSTPLEVMAERESIYQLLSQTTPENLSKNFSQYTIDPLTRYRNVNTKFFKPFQVRGQYEGVDQKYLDQIIQLSEQKSKRYEWMRDSHYLQKWFQKQLEPYKNLVKIHDLTTSFRNGLALSALIHKYRPELLDISSIDANKVAENNQKVFDIAQKEFGIQPVFSGEEMANREVPDKLTITAYLAQFFEYFRKESIRPAKMAKTPEGLQVPQSNLPRPKSPSSRLLFLNKVSQRIRQKRDEDDMEKENDSLKRQRKPGNAYLARKKMKEGEDDIFIENYKRLERETTGGVRDITQFDLAKKQIKEAKVNVAVGVRGQNKVSALAKDLARQFSGEAEAPKKQTKASRLIMGQAVPAEVCYFCKDKVYVVERHTAEGLFFHRGCLKCDYCGSGLRIGGYAFQRTETGEAKFYCFQHHGMSRRPMRARKRSFGDKELMQKLLPVLSPEKPPVISNIPPDKPAESLTPDSNRLRPPPIATPDNIDGDKNKTPERIEFEPESEYEESELEQTAHNLSSSLLDIEDEVDSDSDSEEDDADWSGEDLSDNDRSWAELARSYSKQLKKRLKREEREYGDDSDSDTPTIGASDADYETDTETEEYENARSGLGIRCRDIPALKLSTPKDMSSHSPQKDAKSPASEEIKQSRLSFFSAPSQPVRIDPWSFLGLSKTAPPKLDDMTETLGNGKEDIIVTEDVKGDDFFGEDEVIAFDKNEVLAQELSFSESSSGGEELPLDEVQALQEEYIRCLAEELESESNSVEEEEVQLVQDREHINIDTNREENLDIYRDLNTDLQLKASSDNMNTDFKVNGSEMDTNQATSPPQTLNRLKSSEFDMSEEELQKRREEKQRRMNRCDEVSAGVAGVKQLSLPVVCLDEGSYDTTSLLETEGVASSYLNEPMARPDSLGSQEMLERFNLDSNKDIYTVDDLVRYGLIKDIAVSKAQSEINLSPGRTGEYSKSLAASSSVSSSHLPTTTTTSSVQKSVHQRLAEREPGSPRDPEVQRNRLSFFDNPTEPVRIDPTSFLGIGEGGKDGSSTPLEQTETSELTGQQKIDICLADLSGNQESKDTGINSEIVTESQKVAVEVPTEIMHIDTKSAAVCDSSVSVVENSNIAQTKDSTVAVDIDICDSLSETQMIVLENLKELNDTLSEGNDLSALVSDNVNQLSSDDTLLVQNTEGIAFDLPEELSNENNVIVTSDSFNEDIKNQTLTEDACERDKSSSSESDTKFDTIKRRKQSANKPVQGEKYTLSSKHPDAPTTKTQSQETDLGNLKVSGITTSESSDFPSKDTERRDSEDKSGVVMTSSFYSEGMSSHTSHIADSAPLASLDFEMEMTSGTETDLDQQQTPCLPRKILQEGDLTNVETTEGLSPQRLQSETSGSVEERSKAELEQDAIRRIDELLLSYEQSKETKIDFPMSESSQQTDKTNTITKWLRDTINPSISPISKRSANELEFSSSKPNDNMTNDDSASLPYVSFNTEPSCSVEYESFGTPSAADAAFIESVNKGELSLNVRETDIGVSDDISTKDSDTVNLEGVPVRETDILNDSIGSGEEQLKYSVADQEEHNATNTSVVEFKVSDDEGDHSFKVDEKFISTRDRKKKKMKVSHSASSDFTISTPSGSVESTSTAAELQSAQPSSVPLTASTTGDSFSAVKMSATLPIDEDNISFSDIALAYQRDNNSASLEKLVNQNEDSSGEVTSNDLSSLDKEDNAHVVEKETPVTEHRSEPMDIPSSHGKAEALEAETITLKAEEDLVFSFDNVMDKESGYADHNSSIPFLSTSAPSSVHPFQLYNGDKTNGLSIGTSFEEIHTKTPDKPKRVTSSATDDSFYYTPEVSGIEPMDITENGTPNSPAPSTRTVKSDSTILDDRRTELRKTDSSGLSQSPTSSIVDAKRKFFCETSQPVRIDHFKMFEKERKPILNTPEPRGVVKGWKSLDTSTTTTSTSISAAVPQSNILVGNGEKFFTPATSVKSKPVKSDNGVDLEGFKRPKEVSRRIISEDAEERRAGKSVARELSLEEKKKIFDQEREKARQEARERARMLSDEELGVKPVYTPRKGSFKETKTVDGVKSLEGKNEEASETKPTSTKSYTSQVSKESGASVGKSDASDPSPSSGRKGKGMKVFQKTQKSPKMDKKVKKKNDEEKDQDSGKKEKRKSLLQKLLPSKSLEKKEKSSSKSPMLPTAYNGDRGTAATSQAGAKPAESEGKSKGIIFRSKKSKSLERERKALSMEEGKRESLYKELAPMFHQVLGGPDGRQSVSAVKAKIETVAPPPAKAPYTVLEPPKATEDFDTESEFGDTTSLRSFQESNNVTGLSEEELGKVIKKQQKAAKKRQREQELRRLHTAQEIQRQLEEVEVKQREIEERGVIIERALRGDGPDAKRDESELMQEWFNIVHEKNVLVRYESELMVHARELELEDRHARLEQQLRDRMSIDDVEMSMSGRREDERRILQELVEVVEQRDALVGLLEEDRQREREQEQGLKAIMSAKGFQLSPITYANRMRLPSLGDVHRDAR